MAALIDGFAVHHWTGIPVGEADGAATSRDNHIFASKCQCLRFILIDEISMISAQLLAQIEILVGKVVRRRNPYRGRSDGSTRRFGGVNALLFGDWWQIRPVKQTPLFEQPSVAKSGSALEGLQLVWGRGRDCLQRVWELTQH